ncbi:MAG TPA: hypothetical protein VHO70_19335 [Chitinispirillaceae bacterium]|nr:hypothetical protein [Chitinispirillaceae bacterium]
MDNEKQIREIINYRDYLQHSFGIILDEETAAKLWILKYAAIWRMIQERNDDRNMKIRENFFCYSEEASLPQLY